jgi:tRNA(fMet)-specific endonuclease VapC
MAERYLIDTSAVIKYLNESLPEKGLSFMDGVVDMESNISFVSEIELQVWNPPNPTDLEIYHSFVLGSAIIGINPDIICETIRIRKAYKVKLPDSLIAATAFVNDLTLISDNDVDFGKIPGLKYINPMSIK